MQSSKSKTEPPRKQLDRKLLALIRKGSVAHSKPAIKHLSHCSPYSQPLDKSHSNSGDLTVIEERHRLPRNQSFSTLRSESCSPQHIAKTDPTLALNKALSSQLKALPYDVKKRFRVFQSIFSAVISQDPAFGVVLQRIKTGYEEYFSYCTENHGAEDSEKAAKQLLEFQEVLEQEQAEKQSLLSTIAQLRREKTALTSKLLEKAARIKVLEKNELAVASQEDSLHDVQLTLQSEVALLRSREKLFMNVLKSAKQLGFPIDELMRQHRGSQLSPGSRDISEKTLS